MPKKGRVKDVLVGDSQAVGVSLQSLIDLYAGQLECSIDREMLFSACRLQVRGMRLNAYHAVLRDACMKCFRSTNVVTRGGSYSCDVWGFNGRVWERLSPVVFADAVGAALIAAADVACVLVTEDWIAKKSQLLNDAYSGLCDDSARLVLSSSVVGFANGVWDFSDVDNPVQIPFKDRPCITSLLPYDYCPDAVCPMWLSFLNMMLPKRDVYRLQKYLGLGVVSRRMMGHSVEDTLWLVGNGANGKSTIAKVLSAVYGDGNVSWLSMRELFDRNTVQRQLAFSHLDGKVFNICEEADMSDITRDSDAFKKLCSGSKQSGREIGKNVREIEDVPFLIFMMNRLPSNKRMDAAFRRRLVKIKFEVTVREDDMDTGLVGKLLSELPGIRNWMIEGYKRLRSDGYQFDHTSDEDYMDENEQYFDIFAKHEGLRPSGWAGRGETAQLVQCQVLWECFDDFCKRKHVCSVTPSMKSMALDLKRLGFDKVRKASGWHYKVFCDRDLDYSVKL